MMMKPTPTEARTSSGAAMLGSRCRQKIIGVEVPATIAASM